VNLNGAALTTIQGSNTNYLASNVFTLAAGQSALTSPTDSFYRSFSQSFVASTASNIISFILSDLSTTSHKYWIKNINLREVLVFDPLSRLVLPACPANNFIVSNTQPSVCRSCSVLGQVVNAAGTGCECPPNSCLDANGFCQACHYSCKTCDPLLPTTKCLTCPDTRNLVNNLCACKTGYYEYNNQY
jgi:hypothetical protein